MSTYLKNKWVAAAAILLYSIFESVYIDDFVKPIVTQSIPIVTEAIQPFLPIEIKNGEIIGEEKVVEKIIPFPETQGIKFVLDTRVDAFNIEDLKQEGLYISKKNIYSVKNNGTTVRSLSSYKDMSLDEQEVQLYASTITKILEYLSVFFFFLFLICIPLIVLVYSFFTYLIMLMFGKKRFSGIFVVNSIVYSLIGILALFTPINCGQILTLFILVAVNYLCEKMQG